ncbi:aspartate kinase [Streptomyces sp. PR69]|uniref:aspartate kinase n=1 Tax=Streptomyces sp. PR69 TaxID=2984950 RepID=UPI002264C044|nr:aspartate kinase [Streptomyces sp. PR69]
MGTLGGGHAGDVLVQKYGGSSLATDEQLFNAARRIGAAARAGRRVVAVVSARGSTTDDLIRQAAAVNPRAEGRELDHLLATGEAASASLAAMALQRTGLDATALSGAQSGILASGAHGAGIIVAIDAERTVKLLDSGRIAVIAGFQGVTAEGDVITLGRGGSDTTAVAVAAGLGARTCEIYTDVAGVFSADPRIVPAARLLPSVDVDVMAEMAFAGARVMHARAVELAALYGVDIHVGHAAGAEAGTRIHSTDGEDMLEAKAAVMAVVHDPDVVRITLRTTAAQEDSALAVLQILARQGVPADMAAVSETPGGGQSFGVTVHHTHADAVRRAFAELAVSPSCGVDIDEDVAKVSIVGKGLLSRPGYAARMLSSLTGSGIAARSLSTSQLRVSVTVPGEDTARAVGLLHSEFGLDAGTGPHPLHLAHRP